MESDRFILVDLNAKVAGCKPLLFPRKKYGTRELLCAVHLYF